MCVAARDESDGTDHLSTRAVFPEGGPLSQDRRHIGWDSQPRPQKFHQDRVRLAAGRGRGCRSGGCFRRRAAACSTDRRPAAENLAQRLLDQRRTAQEIGVGEVLVAPRSPWQNPFVERVIGSLRRECLDHVIVWNERSLRRHLQHYLVYYHEWRTHLSLDKDAPVSRAPQPPACGTIVAAPHVGALHHHYERRAA